jgi:hypothetical protein
MALVPITFETDLKAIYAAMDSLTDGSGNRYEARETAKAIKKYILTGQTSTTDTGAAPAGFYSGSGTGSMTISADALESALFNTFSAGSSNPALAANMAADIDNVCKADNTVSETSAGIVTTPSGATSNFSGPAIGKFTGDKTKISVPLAACFEAMNGMMSGGGNDYYAAQFAAALTAYLTAGTITVQLKPPFSSGSGSGKIA